jgi:hypothetical protein
MLEWIYQLATITFVAGIWIGRWTQAHRWRLHGADGYPRLESAGRLYWVNRDDRPCYRCKNGWTPSRGAG